MATRDGTTAIAAPRAEDIARELRRLKPHADVLRFFEQRSTEASDLRRAFRGIVAKAARS